MTIQLWAEGCREFLRDVFYAERCALEEYISQAEQMHGDAYWSLFSTKTEVYNDFQGFLASLNVTMRETA